MLTHGIVYRLQRLLGTLAQILTAILIVVSLFALMTLIYFLRECCQAVCSRHPPANTSHSLVEDVIKERIGPFPHNLNPYRSYEVHEIKSINHIESPRPIVADEKATPIGESHIVTPLPRLPTPPTPKTFSPMPPPQIIPGPPPSERTFTFPQESAFVVDFDKIRRGKSSCQARSIALSSLVDLLNAIEERTIPALEEAIQQVKDHNYFQQLKYECERALELLNRLMKIEHMK